MRLALLSIIVISSFTLITNLILTPFVEPYSGATNNKTNSNNIFKSLNKLDHKYWTIKYINDPNTNVGESLYNISVLTKNPKIINYVNFEILKNYQSFNSEDKKLFFDR